MADTFDSRLKLRLQESGGNSGQWGDLLNQTITNVASVFGFGTHQLTADSDATLTLADDGASLDVLKSSYLKITSSLSLTATRTLTFSPNTFNQVKYVENNTTGGQSITLSQGSGANITIENGATKIVYFDGAGSGAAVVDALAKIDFDNAAEFTTLKVTNIQANDGTASMTLSNSTGNATFSGNVGIGSVNPSVLLDLESTSPTIRFTDSDATGTPESEISGAGGDLVLRADRDNEKSSSLITFEIDGSEHVRIDSSGNAGLGITSPSSYANDANSLAVLGQIRVQGVTNTAGVPILALRDTNSGFFVPNANEIAVSCGAAEALRIDSSRNVLVGKSTLEYSSNAGVILRNDGLLSAVRSAGNVCNFSRLSNDGELIQLNRDGTHIGSIGTEGGDLTIGTGDTGLQFGDGGDYIRPWNTTTNAARDAAVDLGVSTTRFKDLRLSGTAYVDTVLAGKTSENSAVAGGELHPEGTLFLTRSSGNTYHLHDTVGYKWYVNANGGVYNYSGNNVNLSDEREKKNIETLGSQWDVLKKWSLKKFHYNADNDNDPKKYGVIAQDVEIHNPEVVTEFQSTDDETRKAVREQSMMWMAIKALQEAQIRIETLEAEVEALKNG